MANRTIQFFGQGYGEAVSVVATFDGATVFTGDVPSTTDASLLIYCDDQKVLFTATVDSSFNGTKPVSIQVTKGKLIVAHVLINYSRYLTPVFSNEQWTVLNNTNYSAELKQQKINIWTPLANPPFSADDLAALQTATGDQLNNLLLAHNVNSGYGGSENTYTSPLNELGDSRSNIYIDGELQSITHPPGQEGDSSFEVNEGSTVTFDLSITALADGI